MLILFICEFFGCSNEPSQWVLKRTIALSIHNICFGWEIRKLIFDYALQTRPDRVQSFITLYLGTIEIDGVIYRAA